MISLSSELRGTMEFNYRKQQAWATFHKRKQILTNQNVSLRKRLQFFECCINPAIFFGLITLPLTKIMLQAMNALQRRMLRRIIGWRSINTESWEETMRRMKQKYKKKQYKFI